VYLGARRRIAAQQREERSIAELSALMPTWCAGKVQPEPAAAQLVGSTSKSSSVAFSRFRVFPGHPG
jgi:hypothetical protein